MLLYSNEPSAITVSILSFKILSSNPFYHLFFYVQDMLLSQENRKNSIIKKILRKTSSIQICKCHHIFFFFGNFASIWCSVFIFSITGCSERPGPIFAVPVRHLVYLNLELRKCLALGQLWYLLSKISSQ